MVTLFLSGGGDKKFTEKFDQEFKEQMDLTKPLLYIPIAMKGMTSYADCYQWVNSVFNPLGIQEIIMWTDLNHKSIEDLKQCSAVYIGGGNTFSLLNDLRSFKFDEILTEYIESGGIVYGGSAGAIILGADIMTCAHLDSNDVNLKDYKGFNLVNDFAIWCHYELENDELIRNYIKEYEKPVIALPEETGIHFSDGCIRVTGTKPATLFREESKAALLPGSKHSLI